MLMLVTSSSSSVVGVCEEAVVVSSVGVSMLVVFLVGVVWVCHRSWVL